MSNNKRNVSDRGEQMRHRAKNLHQRHMSDIRGAVGCYYCWLGQYSKCTSSCHLVRVTDRDHELAASGGAADHRDVLYRWDHAAPVLTHASQQSQSFYDLAPPKEAHKWVQSASGIGGRQFLDKRDFISVTRHVPEDKPWITSSREQTNRDLLKSISQNIHQKDIDMMERHRQKHEKKLFSLLLPEQFIPHYKYPHGSVTVQATPYTQIAMKQPRRSRTPTATVTSKHEHQQHSFDDSYLDTMADARAIATEQRRRANNLFRGTNRPIFMHNSKGGRFVQANSSIYGGGNVKQTATADDATTPAKQLQRAEEDFYAAQNYGSASGATVLSTAEQLRAALEGRSIQQMKEDRLQAVRARSAGVGSRGGVSRNDPSVRMAETAGQVLSGRYTNAMAMPMPESFSL